MKPQKNPKRIRFSPRQVLYITVILASLFLAGANIFSGIRKDKIRVICDSESFFDKIDYPKPDVVAVNHVTRSTGSTRSTRSGDFPDSDASTADSGIININTASAEELWMLSGIGETKAAEIIQYRTENGGFKSIEEICRINGISDATFNEIRDNITI